MKKIFSALLILCMVFTSLSVAVSASYTKTENKNTFTFDGANSSYDKVFNVGDWYLSNGIDSVKLGSITEHTENFGMKFKKLSFEENTLTGATGSSLSIRGEITKTTNYGTTYTQGDCGTEYTTISNLNTIVGAKDTDGDGNVEAASGKVIKYTVYAYSLLEDGEPLTFNFMRSANEYGIVFTVPASKLYSADGIPHKIELIYYHNGSNISPVSTAAKMAEQNFEIWIDGLLYKHDNVGTNANSQTTHYMFLSPNVKLIPDSNGVVSWKDSELYICSSPDGTQGTFKNVGTAGGNYFKVYTRDTLHNEFFQTATYGANPTVTARPDFVTGVDSELAERIESVYTTALSSGDRVLEVEPEFYNNPASIWADSNDSSVTLVNKAGKVFKIGDSVTGTFADYYIAVNGVYTKVELSSIFYDVDTKTATVNVSKLPTGTTNLQIIVAAYNNYGKMDKFMVSETYNDFTSNITYTINDTFPTDAYKYKVFVFDSITNAKPLLKALEK